MNQLLIFILLLELFSNSSIVLAQNVACMDLFNQYFNIETDHSTLRLNELEEVIFRPTLILKPNIDGFEFTLKKDTRFEINNPSELYQYSSSSEILYSMGKFYHEIKSYLDFVFLRYVKLGIVNQAEVDSFFQIEKMLDIRRSTYWIFRDKVTKNPKLIGRLYDASPQLVQKDFGLKIYNFEKPASLPIEIEYPWLQLEERIKEGTSAKLVEIGRVVKSKDLPQGIWPLIYLLIATHCENSQGGYSNLEGTIYIEATSAGARLYKKDYGFQVVYTPKDLHLQKGQNPRYILKSSVANFLKNYSHYLNQ